MKNRKLWSFLLDMMKTGLMDYGSTFSLGETRGVLATDFKGLLIRLGKMAYLVFNVSHWLEFLAKEIII